MAAAKRAGLPSVPAIVREVDDTTSLEQALVENLHREDLNPLEEAAAYQQLIEDFHLTHDQVAARVGKSRAAVTNTLRLFQLPRPIQKLVADGQLSAGHARPCSVRRTAPTRSSSPAGRPPRAFRSATSRRPWRASSRKRKRAPRSAAVRRRRTRPGLRAPGLLELEELFSQYLDTRVNVTAGPKRGKVVIDFADLEDLERIYRLITSPGATLNY